MNFSVHCQTSTVLLMIAEIVTNDPQIPFEAWIYLSCHAVPKFELRPARDHPTLGLGQVYRITDGVITAA